MNNLSSYCGLVEARISASEKDFTCISDDKKYFKSINEMDKDQMLFTINSQRDVINNMKMEFAMYNRKKQHRA